MIMLVRGLLILHSQPQFRWNKSFVITNLYIFISIAVIMKKNSVNTVICFNIIDYFIALALEICIHIFIGSDIYRTFEQY